MKSKYKFDSKEILKDQIKHLSIIIKVLEDCEERGISLKEVCRERYWLKDQLKHCGK